MVHVPDRLNDENHGIPAPPTALPRLCLDRPPALTAAFHAAGRAAAAQGTTDQQKFASRERGRHGRADDGRHGRPTQHGDIDRDFAAMMIPWAPPGRHRHGHGRAALRAQ
ncbi:hypothetical protein ACTMU2_10385 [Cupriavidus basilensis]